MSSGPRGEEPINLSPHMRQHYARQLADCDQPRCGDCTHARGALIAAGANVQDAPKRAPWEPTEIALFVALLAFSIVCLVLTGGRR